MNMLFSLVVLLACMVGQAPIVQAAIGDSAEQACVSCMDCKLRREAAGASCDSGTYYVKLSTGSAKVVFCDMETQGGGWTTIWSNGGGHSLPGSMVSNSELWGSTRNDIVWLPSYRLQCAMNRAGWDYFRDRPGSEWMKHMKAFYTSSGALRNEQKIRLNFHKDSTWGELITYAFQNCYRLSNVINVYSTRLNGDMSKVREQSRSRSRPTG
jgi:hypothetical protein